jgi:hypothetical protein
MTQGWGIPASFIYKFYFPSLEMDLGLTVSPLSPKGFLLQFLSTLFLTMVLSVE